jgi:uncharacterized membrane protein (DUF106 family)
MSYADHAAWIILATVISGLIGALIHRVFTDQKCGKCGMAELKAEIARLCNLVRALAEKVGMSVKEQLEIESIDRGQ